MSGIKIDFGANVEPFNNAMNSVKSSVNNLASNIGNRLSGIVGFSALIYGSKKYVSALHDIGEESRKMGVSTEYFQKLKFVAERAGTSIGILETAFKRFNKNLYGAETGSNGSQKIVQSLNALGLTVQDFIGKNPEEKFKLVIEGLGKIGDASERSALASNLLSRSGADLNNVFKEFKSLSDEFDKGGMLISDESIKQADQLHINFQNISTSLAAIISQSGVFDDMAKGMNELFKVTSELKKLEKENKDSGYTVNYGESSNFKSKSFLGGTLGLNRLFPGMFEDVPTYQESPLMSKASGSEIGTSREKMALQKQSDQKFEQVRNTELKRQEEALSAVTNKKTVEQKKIQEEEINLNLLKAQNQLSEYNFGIFKIIAEYDKKISNAKDKQLKTVLAKEAAQEIINYEQKNIELNQGKLQSIRDEINVSKMKVKLDKKQITDKELAIYQARITEKNEIATALKENASTELINAIKEKAALNIAGIINSQNNSVPLRGSFGMIGEGIDEARNLALTTSSLGKTETQKLQEKSVQYEKEQLDQLKELNRKNFTSKYG